MSDFEAHSRDWLIFSNSRLERVALAQIAVDAGAKRVHRAAFDATALHHARGAWQSAPLILAALGTREAGLEAIVELSNAFPEAFIILFPKENCELPAASLLPGNIRAVFRSDLEERQITSAISLVAAGYEINPHMPEPAPSETLVPANANHASLTPRERDVGRHIARGQSNKEIARALGITVNTVNVHVGSIRRKLGVRNRTQIALNMAVFAGAAQ
ncbi:MAG: response regulator transcription factor [Pseudomonadota bacterium]